MESQGEATSVHPSQSIRQALEAAAVGRRYGKLPTPVGPIKFQNLTAREMRGLRRWLSEEGQDDRWNLIEAALICRCVVDEEGRRVFSNSEVDAGTFEDWDGALIKALGAAIDEHTGFTADGLSIQLLEESAKN